jgi:peptidoglycan/LPS O-acetylase OafA/YrhL
MDQSTTDPRTNSHIELFDVLRGIAILSVFSFHALGASFGFYHLAWAGLWRNFQVSPSFLIFLPFTYGWAGVAVFFAVSGFCIHLSHVRSGDTGYLSFFVRRFFRIYPPYLLCLLVFFFIPPWGSLAVHTLGEAAQLISHVLLIHNFDDRSFFGVNPSFWSIAVEIQLYVLYPLLLVLISRFGWKRTLLVLAVLELFLRTVGAGYQVFTSSDTPIWLASPGTPLAYWLSWALGAYLADKHIRRETLPFSGQPVWFWTLLSIGSFLFRPTVTFSFLAFSFLTVIIIARCLNARAQPPARHFYGLSRCLRLVGLASYSFYLIHQPILMLTPRILHKLSLQAKFAPPMTFAFWICLSPLIFLASWWMYRILEKGSVRLGMKLLGLKLPPNGHFRSSQRSQGPPALESIVQNTGS